MIHGIMHHNPMPTPNMKTGKSTNVSLTGSVPILHPSVLVLTKIKRCVHFIGSSRPLSMSKFRTDIDDIKFLLEWLVKEGQHIDFDDYQAANVDRLYTATKDLVAYWRQKGKSDLVELMEAVLKPADRRKIM